jgi:hypothetical protein
MKKLYLNNGKINTVFNELATAHDGVLNTDNGEYRIAFNSGLMNGSVEAVSFINGINVIQVDLRFSEDVRLSVESLNKSAVLFGYVSKGNIKHSLGISGRTNCLRAHHSGIFNSKKNINTVLYFEQNKDYKFTLISVTTDNLATSQTTSITTKIAAAFAQNKAGFAYQGLQDSTVAKKLAAYSSARQDGMINHLFKKELIHEILNLEVGQHTDGFTRIVNKLSALTAKQIGNLKSISTLVKSYSLEQIYAKFLIEK